MSLSITDGKPRKTILVVDDDPATLLVLTRLLDGRDYDVRPARTGALALETMKLELPDLILLDIRMPEMDGYALCRQLKRDERTREIPVIFISGLDQSMDKVRAFDAGGVDYITKPFQGEEVLVRVKTHIELRSVQKDLEEANRRLRRSHEQLERLARECTSQLMSERMSFEEDKRTIEQRLLQIQKMEAIGTLAGGIAHDFNNVLAPIVGYAELAMQEVPENSRVKGNLEQILMAADRAKDLVMQILSFSRQTEQQPKPIQISLIVKEVAKFLKASLPSTIEISVEIVPDAMQSRIIGDPTKLHQVLMNLCVNAGHAMLDGGGQLKIELSSADVDSVFAVQNPQAKPECYLKLSVSDTGHGMDQNTLQRIFEPYFTTKDPGQGTGLGLSVAYGIVKACGGWIDVESERGKGSTFEVFLPVIECPAGTAREPEPVAFHCSGRVLLVDDEEAIVDLSKEMLEKFGFEVVATHDSLEALERFRSEPESFDLVLTDLTMPGMTGLELARSILKVRPDLPIILCSGFSEAIHAEKARESGLSGFIMKPMSMMELAETIRGVLDYKVDSRFGSEPLHQGGSSQGVIDDIPENDASRDSPLLDCPPSGSRDRWLGT